MLDQQLIRQDIEQVAQQLRHRGYELDVQALTTSLTINKRAG